MKLNKLLVATLCGGLLLGGTVSADSVSQSSMNTEQAINSPTPKSDQNKAVNVVSFNSSSLAVNNPTPNSDQNKAVNVVAKPTYSSQASSSAVSSKQSVSSSVPSKQSQTATSSSKMNSISPVKDTNSSSNSFVTKDTKILPQMGDSHNDLQLWGLMLLVFSSLPLTYYKKH